MQKLEDFYRNGNPRSIRYLKQVFDPIQNVYHDVYSRDDGPAIIMYDYENGQVVLEEYRNDRGVYRKDGPAVIIYENGFIKEQSWFIDNAIVKRMIYHLNSKQVKKIYHFGWHNTIPRVRVLHHTFGPAYLQYNFQGKILKSEYWIKGVRKGLRELKKEFGVKELDSNFEIMFRLKYA